MIKVCGIYKIESRIKSERCYIGSSKDIHNRWKKHLLDLRKNKHHSPKLQYHYNKYGEADLLFSVLIGCDQDSLLGNEQFFIDSLTPYFNVCLIAGNCVGISPSPETRRKLGDANKISMLGNKNAKGAIRSKETREKMSIAAKKRICTEEMKARLRTLNLGREDSEETRIKRREAGFRRKQTDATKEKIRLIRTGTSMSKEAIAKMSLRKKGKTWEQIYGEEGAARRRNKKNNTL